MGKQSHVTDQHHPILLVLAAGLGTRYGGLKQLEAFGPGGEALMEYSIFDAIQAGFKKIIFVINQAHKSIFEEQILPKYQDRIAIDHVIQKITDIPAGVQPASLRKKPWGTGHAIFSARHIIHDPFAVINADDFYGASAFQQMSEILSTSSLTSKEFCLIGYKLSNTLSEHGSVSRGICTVTNNYLSTIQEMTGIKKSNSQIFGEFNGTKQALSPESLASMNFWGFSPLIFRILEDRFNSFLKEHMDSDTAEFYIADPLDYAIKENISRVKLYTTTEKWFGVTHPADKQIVQDKIKLYINQGQYPEKL